MTTATVSNVTTSFFDDEEESLRFKGTIILSEEVVGKYGTQWFQAIYNHDTGRIETNYVGNASRANPKAWARSNKKRVLDAFQRVGVATKGLHASDYIGVTADFVLFEKENPGMNPTLLFLPEGRLYEPMPPAWCAEKAAEYRARVGNRGGQTTGAPTPPKTTYTFDQLEGVAELLDGATEDEIVAIAEACPDPVVQRGLKDGTIIAAAMAVNALGLDDDGVFRARNS